MGSEGKGGGGGIGFVFEVGLGRACWCWRGRSVESGMMVGEVVVSEEEFRRGRGGVMYDFKSESRTRK